MFSPLMISLLTLLAFFQFKLILKHRKWIYILAWIAVILLALTPSLGLLAPFKKGYVGFSFFYIVMMAGALPVGWKLTKRLKAVRAPYSIVGFIFLLVHPLSFANKILTANIAIPWFGLLSFIIMIPLFITSYMFVRRRMKPSTWGKLQRFAYISYALLFVHIILNATTAQNRVTTILLALIYILSKFLFVFKKK